MVDRLDEYPIHQAPLSMAYVATSDRNAYDRYYFNAFSSAGGPMMLTGLGIYPNLGTADAFATVRVGDRQVSIHASDLIETCDRLAPSVGPYRLEVVDPLHELHLTCDADEHGVGFDLTWKGSFPAVDEEPHLWRVGPKVSLDAQRFAQVGTWEGVIRVEGTEHRVTPDTWQGTRDRSWGIRPVGEPEPPGRAAANPIEGFWWLYVPLRFDDFAVVVIVQEDPDGTRTLNDAVRIWPDASRRPEQLGWPEVDIHYASGTRIPTGATIGLKERGGKALTLEVESMTYVALNAGSGYGGGDQWSHGRYQGEGWIEGTVHDLTDPAVAGMVPFGLLDHAAKATLDGHEGHGLFEHGTFGRHDPSGFADYGSVAP